NAIANISSSHLRRDVGFAVWCRHNLVPQSFPPAYPRWKRICHIHDGHVHGRSIPSFHETPNEQCFRWRPGVLSCDNGMGDRAAQRRETGIFEWGALLVALAVGASIVTYGFEAAKRPTHSIGGVPAGMFFFLGSVA